MTLGCLFRVSFFYHERYFQVLKFIRLSIIKENFKLNLSNEANKLSNFNNLMSTVHVYNHFFHQIRNFQTPKIIMMSNMQEPLKLN